MTYILKRMLNDAVVVASGNSERANLGFNKVFFVMKNNKTVLENACEVFINDNDCEHIIVVTNESDKVFKNNKVITINGGNQRADSVKNRLSIYLFTEWENYLKKRSEYRKKNEPILKIPDDVDE